VNVSTRLMLTPDFIGKVSEILAETGVSASRLSLEFSESAVLDQERVWGHLAEVAATGVRLALDDFGVSSISLATLRALHLSRLKIDCRSAEGEHASEAADVIDLVMSISRLLRLETVAKMIETPAQLDWARHMGLTLGQGYHLVPPMPAAQLTGWLDETTAVSRPPAE
jgi:EAL domain-containing protein (putative c-di-GMP-specific phosphodiesterase class I)